MNLENFSSIYLHFYWRQEIDDNFEGKALHQIYLYHNIGVSRGNHVRL